MSITTGGLLGLRFNLHLITWRLIIIIGEKTRETGKYFQVSWRDPLAILYLTPVPAELQLHYGIEISCQRGENTDKLVEIVGYQETRYFRQIWHYHHARGSVEGSTMTLDTPNANPNVEQTKDSSIEAFTYRESFSNIYPQDGPVQV